MNNGLPCWRSRPSRTSESTALKRSLNLPLLVLYGLGTTIGAGIYALTGKVAEQAGMLAPLSFGLAAVLAGFTAYSFAELSGRFPRAAAEAVYVGEAFGNARLGTLVGLLVVLAGSVSAATISNGFAGYMNELFPGMRVKGCYQFRVTRNSDLWIDEEEVENLLHALKGELQSRRFGAAVRLEVADNCPADAETYLLEQMELTEADLYRVHGPVNLHRLAALISGVSRPDLTYPPFVPGLPRRLQGERSVFDTIKRGDVVVHHPFESFGPVLELVRAAAHDPDVLANEYITEVDYPEFGKSVKVHGSPWRFSETPASIGVAPKLGEHTEEILRRIGYSDEQIGELTNKSVI